MRISLEEFATVTAAIHRAAASPEQWPEALSAVALRFARPAEDGARSDGRWHTVLSSLDRLSVAAFVVSATGVVRHRNLSAQALVEREPLVKVVDLCLRLSSPSAHTMLRTALRRAMPPDAQLSVFAARAGSAVHEFNVSPLKDGGVADAAHPAPMALVIVSRPRIDAEGIAERVRRMHGLTCAEARVTAALALGDTVEQIAGAHGVRTCTVRAQVRTIFEKTGVHRQADLIRLALVGQPLVRGRPDR